MIEINADFNIDQFAETEIELWALRGYLDALERYLPFMREQERLKTTAWLKGRSSELDESDIDIARFELDQLVDHVLPRFFLTPFLVILWSAYESAISKIASYLQQLHHTPLTLQDYKKTSQGKQGNFLSRTRRYFKDELHFPLCVDDRLYECLQRIVVLRDSIAHGNGQRGSINREHWKKIERWLKLNIGISVLDDNLMFEESFLQESYTIVNDSLTDLLKRIREERDSNKKEPA